MSRFELCKFTPAPDPELICGICMNVLDTPDETPCRHVFCRDCILTAVRENQKCPVCRAPCREGQTKEVVPLVQNLINKLTMRCDYFDNGCTDLILKEFFLDHVKTCEFEMVQCRYKSCSQSLLRRDCEQHELNTCAYRDRVCEKGCGLMIPLENATTHNCVEALVGLVKDLKEKNQDLQKQISELQHVSESVAQSKTSVALQASQRDDDDDWSFHSITYDYNISDSSFNDTTSFSSHSWDTDLANEAAWNEPSDLANRRRSSRLAALPRGSESDPSARHLGESDQSHTSEILGNGSSSDCDNADRSLDNEEITDGNNTDETHVYQIVQDINSVDICQWRIENVDVSPQAALEKGESSSVLDSPSNGASSKTSTVYLSVKTEKRELEEDSGFCDDNTARTQIKQLKRSNSQEPISTQAQEIALMSNTSNTALLDGANECPNGITEPMCDAAVSVSGGPVLTVACEVTAAEPLTGNTEVSQIGHTLTSSSDSTDTMSSSHNIRVNVNPLIRGPVTRSRGQDGHVVLEGNEIPYVKVPPTCAYLLHMYAQEDDSSDDESWSPSHENLL